MPTTASNCPRLLRAHNFDAWRQGMERLLGRAKLWDHVNDNSPPPEQPTPSAYDSPLALEEACKRYDKWQKTEHGACTLVRLSVAFPPTGIRRGLTAHAIWSNLIEFYGQRWDGIHFPTFLNKWHAALKKCSDGGIQTWEIDKIQTFVNIVKKCGNSRFEDWATQALSDEQRKFQAGTKCPRLDDIENELRFLWDSERRKWREGARRAEVGSRCLQADGPYREPALW